MVDCGNLRCFQERRSFRKELLSWSKKVPYLVGLEAVAAELGGRKKVNKLFEPFNCLESKEVQDWKPEKNCFYCKERIQLLFDAIEKTDSKEGGRILRDHPSLRHLSEVLPFCPQFYTSNFGRDILLDIKTSPPEPQPQLQPEIEVPAPQPVPKPNIELKVPNLPATSKQPKKEIMSNGKKAYTEEELTAAVSDIRSGKLGTRRAASLYGIPRSTLRNKIFKMDVDDMGNVTGIIDEEESNDAATPQEQPLELSDLIQLSTLQYLAPIAMPFIINQEIMNEDSEWEKRLQHIRHKHNLNNSCMDHYMEKALQHKLKPFLQEIIKKLVEERFEMECNAARARSSEGHESELFHSSVLRALNFNSVNNNQSSSGSSSPALSISVPLYNHEQTTSKSLLKEENALKGFHSHFKYENTKIGDTLKDIIVKTISEKVRCKLEASDFGGFSTSSDEADKMKAKETIMSAFSIPDKLCSPAKKVKREPDTHIESQTKNLHTVSASTQVKKTRPKRGQYRKYNSQLLTEAVRAVQRGEMSVHRAGSYYGVPHSTLEYKVKERHLLRQKKIKEQQQLKQQKEEEEKQANQEKKKEESAEPSTSNKTDSSKLATDLLSLSTPKSVAGPAWLPPFAGPTPFESAAALGLFGSGFALSTPASELLRKLQHKVQS